MQPRSQGGNEVGADVARTITSIRINNAQCLCESCGFVTHQIIKHFVSNEVDSLKSTARLFTLLNLEANHL